MNTTPAPVMIWKSVVAVCFGLLVTMLVAIACDIVLRAIMPDVMTGNVTSGPALAFMIGYMAAIEVLAGWVTARNAPRAPVLHAALLGGILLGFAVIAAGALWDTAPVWYHAVSLLPILPATCLGGWIWQRSLAASPTTA